MDEPRSLTTPSLLGILVGLAVVATATAALLVRRGHELGREAGTLALEERFELADSLPGGFEVRGARQLSSTELYVSLGAPGEAPEEPAPLPFKGRVGPKKKRSRQGHGSWDPKNRTEWEQVGLREAGAAPVEAGVLFAMGKKRGDAFLGDQFSRIQFKDIANVDGEGEAVPVDSGHLDWHGFEATWIQLRHFKLTDDRIPTCHDTVRVNLTTTGEARVLYLRWARGYPGGVSAVVAWLSALAPRG
jgi:hypothetical protein